jgi:hypothetical protein
MGVGGGVGGIERLQFGSPCFESLLQKVLVQGGGKGAAWEYGGFDTLHRAGGVPRL